MSLPTKPPYFTVLNIVPYSVILSNADKKIMALKDNLASLQRYIKNIPDDIKKELELRKSIKQINDQERYR